jgi:hypothetical protein
VVFSKKTLDLLTFQHSCLNSSSRVTTVNSSLVGVTYIRIVRDQVTLCIDYGSLLPLQCLFELRIAARQGHSCISTLEHEIDLTE